MRLPRARTVSRSAVGRERATKAAYLEQHLGHPLLLVAVNQRRVMQNDVHEFVFNSCAMIFDMLSS
jgi:hypothetical protein